MRFKRSPLPICFNPAEQIANSMWFFLCVMEPYANGEKNIHWRRTDEFEIFYVILSWENCFFIYYLIQIDKWLYAIYPILPSAELWFMWENAVSTCTSKCTRHKYWHYINVHTERWLFGLLILTDLLTITVYKLCFHTERSTRVLSNVDQRGVVMVLNQGLLNHHCLGLVHGRFVFYTKSIFTCLVYYFVCVTIFVWTATLDT